MSSPSYPAHWEADVLLADGTTATVRPIRADDAERLVQFYARVSDESKYNRFFAPYPRLSDRDVARFTQVDHQQRVAFIVLGAGVMHAVGRYEGTGDGEAEVAFLVEDSQQGRGLGSLLLEHLAQAGRERGIRRFVADVLPHNRKMIKVFREAGYRLANTIEEGVQHLEFDIQPTDVGLAVMTSREHHAEALSIAGLLTPSSVAVVGASRSRDTIGQALVRNLVLSGFTGPVYAVNPTAVAIAGVPAYPTLRDIPHDVDLAIVAVPAESVPDVVRDAAERGVKGLVVVSSGFAESGAAGRERQSALVRLAHAHGMRVVGPNCLGIVNTDPKYALNASIATVVPQPGRIGFFSQSGALGDAILEQVSARGLGLSTFVSAGNRADVSGNDLLQFWQEDERTDVVLLWLESFGNPRKFSRIARRTAHTKPVVVIKSGGVSSGPRGHTVAGTEAPDAAVDALFRQSGVIRVDTLPQLLDVAQLLAYQPLPAGRRIAVVGNSDALDLLAADSATSNGLEVVDLPQGRLAPDARAAEYAAALHHVLDLEVVDAAVVIFAPALASEPTIAAVALAVTQAAERAGKPVLSTFLGVRGVPEPLRRVDELGVPSRGSIPSYASPEEAVRALAQVATYAAWRRQPLGTTPELTGCDSQRARTLVAAVLREHPEGAELPPGLLLELLACYGIALLPMLPAATVQEAIAAAEQLDGEVVLKATATHLRHRPDLSEVWRNISDAQDMQVAWETMSRTLADPTEASFVVQRQSSPGLPVVLRAREDALFGPIVSFGISGVATELLGDRSYRIPPLTQTDAAAMIREVAAAPLLFGYRGAAAADVGAVEELLHRLSRLTDDLPEVAYVELDPVLVGTSGLSVVNGSARVLPPPSRADWYVRRLP